MKKLYLLKSGDFYKIGIAENVQKRIKSIQTGNPHKVELVAEYEIGEQAQRAEAIFHRIFSKKRMAGEWFDLNEQELSLFLETCPLINVNDVLKYRRDLKSKWISYVGTT